MRVVVVGGKLQGVEAAYLAGQAGWDVTLVDRNPQVPAAGLCDSFRQLDIVQEEAVLPEVFQGADLIIPALEDDDALSVLVRAALAHDFPLAFDLAAYHISSSKRKSDLLFEQHNIPAPRYWPNCSFPIVAKPSSLSGSSGVRVLSCAQEMEELLKEVGSAADDYVFQEFLEGDSYSLEVIGLEGNALPLLTTALEMDAVFDCKRVTAPVELDLSLERQFQVMAKKVAGLLNLTGVMDLEVILHNGVLKLLEIDARLPSQTPTAVYKAAGVNILELLYQVIVKNKLPQQVDLSAKRGVVYEHIMVTPQGLETLGEHIMADAGPLKMLTDFYGADEALTNFAPGRAAWVATLIITGADSSEAWKKRCAVIDQIRRYCC